MLTRKFYLLGRDRLIDELAPPPAGRVLEIACGTGRNLIGAARHYPDGPLLRFRHLGGDARHCARQIRKAGLDERIRIAAGDATDFSRRAAVRRRGLRSHLHLLCPVDDPAVAASRCSKRWAHWRRAGVC